VRRDLVERARGGNRDAFTTLAADSIGRLFNIAQCMLRNRDLADDAVQETLVLAWRDLPGLRDLDGFDAWLHRVLVRCVYREANRERRRSACGLGSPVGVHGRGPARPRLGQKAHPPPYSPPPRRPAS